MSIPFSLDLASLRAAYGRREFTPTQLIDEILCRIDAHADPAVWIHRLSRTELFARAAQVEALGPESQPLFGVPFAIKDNIDLAGAPTTAGCPEFSYTPEKSAPVVERLIAAGAIPIGKTNLDQFATGLVGVRSPYGVPRNPFHAEMIPGGSSSGSACAVAAGLVSFSLGTDTAGSGRVPASFQNLVGLKPTRGWLSTRGVVPACRSLDCVSIFALTVEDAGAVAQVAGGFDPADSFSRPSPVAKSGAGTETPFAAARRDLEVPSSRAPFRFGVPVANQLEWFGDTQNPALFANAVRTLESLGGSRVDIDFSPFRDAARLLYEGPWVAERWSAIRAFHARHADAIFPVTRQIIEGGATSLAVDAFESWYKLAELRRESDGAWTQIDALVLPTAPTIYTRSQVDAEPIALNSRLGYYTNFANLLDTAALAVPGRISRRWITFRDHAIRARMDRRLPRDTWRRLSSRHRQNARCDEPPAATRTDGLTTSRRERNSPGCGRCAPHRAAAESRTDRARRAPCSYGTHRELLFIVRARRHDARETRPRAMRPGNRRGNRSRDLVPPSGCICGIRRCNSTTAWHRHTSTFRWIER